MALVGGLLVHAILGAARLSWNRRRVPTALARSVRRTSYLGVVLAESARAGTTQLDVLAPRLAPARAAPLVRRIQHSWAAIVRRGVVREECIEAGAELSVAGIEQGGGGNRTGHSVHR